MPQKPADYVSPFQGMGGKINTMDRFEEMSRGATGAPPAPAKAAPAKAPKPEQQAAVQQKTEQMSIDALIRAIRETVAQAGALLPGGGE